MTIKRIILLAVLYTAFITGVTTYAEVVRIDFGSIDSAVMKGFTAVTPKTIFNRGMMRAGLILRALRL